MAFPSGRACCGQLHVNSGYFKEAHAVVANHVQAFDTDAPYELPTLWRCCPKPSHGSKQPARKPGSADTTPVRHPIVLRRQRLTGSAWLCSAGRC
ncbi:hypothetical protein [Arthrobacter alpinus]|uniref:hypothetical protein n=1 Tax=Arthrobacter alpinus TaxID=656366 RepID=UPI003C72CA68